MHALMVGEKLRLKKNVENVSFRLTAEEFKEAEISPWSSKDWPV
jgi:hypothetical protein